MVIGDFLENGFEATLISKTHGLSVWKGHFSVFCKFLIEEVETIFGENEAKHLKLFNSVIWSFLENGFEATLSSKMNVSSVWKGHCSVFWKLLSDEVETVFWESEAKHQNFLIWSYGAS